MYLIASRALRYLTELKAFLTPKVANKYNVREKWFPVTVNLAASTIS